MPKYAVAFITPSEKGVLKHALVEGPDRDSALKTFFTNEAGEYYSNDEQGYYYFKEDFFDDTLPSGSIIQCG